MMTAIIDGFLHLYVQRGKARGGNIQRQFAQGAGVLERDVEPADEGRAVYVIQHRAFRLFEDAVGRCVVAVELGEADSLGEAAGGSLRLRLDGQGGWTCEASGIPDRQVPSDCR